MRILLVEDDHSLAHAISTMLQKNNYCVDISHNGLDALTYLESGLYDAMILDIMLPKTDGFSVLKKIRAQNNPLPIMILSAKRTVEDKVSGLDFGANDYLTKPFDMRELLARLRNITRVSCLHTSSILQIGNLKLSENNCMLSTHKGSYQLTNKEFQMLRILMNAPNQIISAELFLSKIWDTDSDAEENTVWTYISYLRRKMESLSANVRIVTKRNLGYVLEEIT